jgi:hypothetical protein
MFIVECVRRLWRTLQESGLGASVRAAANKYLVEFGYKEMRSEHGGIQYTVELQHCEVSFWLYKADIGSSIRPIAADPNVCYESIQADEVPIKGRSMRSEVDRQMRFMVEKYQPVLRGDFTDWPKRDD